MLLLMLPHRFKFCVVWCVCRPPVLSIELFKRALLLPGFQLPDRRLSICCLEVVLGPLLLSFTRSRFWSVRCSQSFFYPLFWFDSRG